jgi:hypothetical protein
LPDGIKRNPELCSGFLAPLNYMVCFSGQLDDAIGGIRMNISKSILRTGKPGIIAVQTKALKGKYTLHQSFFCHKINVWP